MRLWPILLDAAVHTVDRVILANMKGVVWSLTSRLLAIAIVDPMPTVPKHAPLLVEVPVVIPVFQAAGRVLEGSASISVDLCA